MFKLLNPFIQVLLLSITTLKPDKSPKLDLNFLQHDYTLIMEHLDVVSYNKDYLQYFTATTFKYNRTCTAFNISFFSTVEMGTNVEAILQTYKFASNEYRLFPLRFQFNPCDGFKKNMFGVAGFTKCGNVSGCPLKKATAYKICNFTPDESKFPPFIPTGRYMVEVQVLDGLNDITITRAYAEVARPFQWQF